jgi:serine phosphatase RsbU (regulator of sigma subunit)
MELAAKRYARWVLIIHVVVLALVVSLVYFAARDIYYTQRRAAIEHASEVQSLLARQTARGIQDYYNSVIDTLQSFRRATEGEGLGEQANLPAGLAATPQNLLAVMRDTIVPAMWQQVKNRADDLVVVDRLAPTIIRVFPSQDSNIGPEVLDQAGDWLRGLRLAAVSDLHKVDGRNVNLVAVPLIANARIVFVAVVPQQNIDTKLLGEVHAKPDMSAMLMDQNMRVMTASDKSIVGVSIIKDESSPYIQQLAEKYIRTGKPGTEIIESEFNLGQRKFTRGLVSVEPIEILGTRWWLTIGSDLDRVDSVVNDTFRSTVMWGIFLVVAATAILMSTAVQMIRTRVRMERVKHEVLTRELTQARKIQLAWLPRNEDDPPNIDLSAINKPASHISGDFYNWFELEGGKVCVVIGDVTGHGMAAAFLMATTQLLVRMVMPRAGTPGKCMEFINRQLCRQIFSGQFVTMLIIVIDRDHGKLEITTAGHPPPLVGERGTFRPLKMEPQLVLGVDADATYPTETFQIPDAAAMVLYTDGLPDAVAPSGDRFSAEGLQQALNGIDGGDAASLADHVVMTVDQFRGPRELDDDLTIVTLRLKPARESLAVGTGI